MLFTEEKVKIIFKNAVNETLNSFANDVPGKYQAVYEVYPVRDENLAYQISRMITVKSREPESSSKSTGHTKTENNSDEESEEADPAVPSDIAGIDKMKELEKPSAEQSAGIPEAETSDREQELVAVEDVEDSLFLSVVPAYRP